MTARHSPLFTLGSGQSGLGIYTSQRDAAEAGCLVTYGEKASSTVPSHKRQALQEALGALEQGDTLVVVKLDRLGRTQSEVVARLAELSDRGVYVETLDGLLNTGALGRMPP